MFAAGKPPATRVRCASSLLCNLVCVCLGVCVTAKQLRPPNHRSMIMTFILRYEGEQMLRVLGCQATARQQLLLSYGPTVVSPIRSVGGGGWGGEGGLVRLRVDEQELWKQRGWAVCVHCMY